MFLIAWGVSIFATIGIFFDPNETAFINESQIIKSTDDISKLPKRIDPRITSLMSVHLFSSCPMGEDKEICVTNSYGKVHGEENLYVSDASILPSAIGVNPQGSLMAFAHRNIDKIISSAWYI